MSLRERVEPPLYELLGRPMEHRPVVIERRRQLLAPAEGRVLEVGAGPGFNLPHYPAGIGELVVTDELAGMVRRAARRAEQTRPEVAVRQAPVERLPFEDASFDTVVGSLLLCSVADQDRALAEIRRVLHPGGSFLFLEHVRSPNPGLARRQDRLEPLWRRLAFGCRPNRDTAARIAVAFDVEIVDRGEFPAGPRIVRPYVLGRGVAR